MSIESEFMVSTKHMLLFISSAGIRRAVGPSLASAFLTTHAPSAVVPASSAATAAIAQAWSRHKQQQQQPMTARFMSTDAPAEEKTEEEKAALKAARDERK